MHPKPTRAEIDATILEIHRIARGVGLAVAITERPRLKRAMGTGSIGQRASDGQWIGRVTRDGRKYQVASKHRDECERRLAELVRRLAGARDLPPIDATILMPDGREYARLNSAKFRRWIYARDQGLCGICHRPVPFAEMHVDHIRPRIEGGTDHVSNFRVTHAGCNLRRRAERDRLLRV